MTTHLDEGVFFADKSKHTIRGETEEEVKKQLQQALQKFAKNNPKVIKEPQPTSTGYMAVLQYNTDKEGNDKSLSGRISNGIKGAKAYFDQEDTKKKVSNVKDTVKAGAKAVGNMVKDTAAIAKDSVAKGTLEATDQGSMEKQKEQLQKKYPNAQIKYKDYSAGTKLKADYYFKSEPKQQNNQQAPQQQQQTQQQPQQAPQQQKATTNGTISIDTKGKSNDQVDALLNAEKEKLIAKYGKIKLAFEDPEFHSGKTTIGYTINTKVSNEKAKDYDSRQKEVEQSQQKPQTTNPPVKVNKVRISNIQKQINALSANERKMLKV